MRAIQKGITARSTALLGALLLAAPLNPSAAQDWQNALPQQGDPVARAAEHDRLFAALAAAKSEAEARAAADQVWLFWFRPPDAQSGTLMDKAMERRRNYDFAAAEEVLDKLVTLAPDWAEAWNQRATIRFLRENFDGSLDDIERVLELEPKHFGALSGQALILMRFGRFDTAQSALRAAVAINPFLAERALLLEEPKPEGKDI